jgi:hypothetical protein
MTVTKCEITHYCEAKWRHKGTRKVESHTYPFVFDGEYLRLCRSCWEKVDGARGIKNRGKGK